MPRPGRAARCHHGPGCRCCCHACIAPNKPAPSTGFPNGHRKGARPQFGEPPPRPAHSPSDTISGRTTMGADGNDRLGGRSDSQAEGRTDTGPIKRFADDDRGENPAEHFPGADPEVARRLAGADTGSLRSQERDDAERRVGHDAGQGPRQDARGGDRTPIYEGATSTSGVGGLDAGMGSAGVSAGSGSPAGSPATGGSSTTAPGVTSTTGAGYSTATGTNRTGGPTPGRDDADRETAQPPRDSPP